jgi:hypothetical protein
MNFNSENPDVHISDFRAYGILNTVIPTLSNVALNKPATSQSASGTGVASRANDADGSNASFWNGIGHPQWWEVDLGGNYDLSSIVVRNWVDGTRYYQYTVEASIDGLNYTQIAAKTSTDAATDLGDVYAVSVTARYLRVNVEYNSENPDVHISDFRAYGTLQLGGGAKGVSSVKQDRLTEIKVNVYPNPFRDHFTIRFDSPYDELYDISIIDLKGRIVLSKTDIAANMDNTFNLQLAKGIYILRVNHKGIVMTQRIVKY